MATEMITLKLDDKFLDDIDGIVKKEGYHNRTEFIRNALREQVNKAKMKQTIMELAHLKGKSNRTISNKEYEQARKKAFEELEKKIR